MSIQSAINKGIGLAGALYMYNKQRITGAQAPAALTPNAATAYDVDRASIAKFRAEMQKEAKVSNNDILKKSFEEWWNEE